MATAVKTTKDHDHADKKRASRITRSQAQTSETMTVLEAFYEVLRLRGSRRPPRSQRDA